MAQQSDPSTVKPEFLELIDLASQRVGGRAIVASDEFFAAAENLLKPEPAVFIPGKFTERGKWMDGWESRRKREPGHDWCVIRLGLPGLIRGFEVDTAHFTGNYPEACSIDAAESPGDLSPTDAASTGIVWRPVLPRTALGPSRAHHLPAAAGNEGRITHVRLNIFPDGGVARLRVYGGVLPDWNRLLRDGDSGEGGPGTVDLAAAANGGLVVGANDMHFGSRHNLVMPGRAANMGDGWETRRKRGLTWGPAGVNEFDWCVIRLGRRGVVKKIEVDTNHFKGNFPESCAIECCDGDGDGADWRQLLPRTKLSASERRYFDRELVGAGVCTHVRLKIYPDGGVSRLRVYGTPA